MNEPHIGDTSTGTLKWICETGKQIRGNVGDRNQLVLTGGGSGKDSVQGQFSLPPSDVFAFGPTF